MTMAGWAHVTAAATSTRQGDSVDWSPNRCAGHDLPDLSEVSFSARSIDVSVGVSKLRTRLREVPRGAKRRIRASVVAAPRCERDGNGRGFGMERVIRIRGHIQAAVDRSMRAVDRVC